MTKVTHFVPIEDRKAATPETRWTVLTVLLDESESKHEAMFIARQRHQQRGLSMTAVWAPYDVKPSLTQLEDARRALDTRRSV